MKIWFFKDKSEDKAISVSLYLLNWAKVLELQLINRCYSIHFIHKKIF